METQLSSIPFPLNGDTTSHPIVSRSQEPVGVIDAGSVVERTDVPCTA